MKNNLWNILKKELRELFRDKKSLAMMLIIPIFIPLIMLGMSALFEMQSNKDVEEFNKIGFGYELSDEEKQIAEQMNSILKRIDSLEKENEELKEYWVLRISAKTNPIDGEKLRVLMNRIYDYMNPEV